MSDVRLQNALTESKQQEDKYQASHPNLRKLDTSGKHRHMMMHFLTYACLYTLYITYTYTYRMFIHESALPSDERNRAFQNIESFQPICIMTHCFRALETPLAGQNSVNATKTCIKNTFYKPITNVFLKV